MPRTKFQEFIFTIFMATCMVCVMSLYNAALKMGELTYETFPRAFENFIIELPIAFVIAFFFGSKFARTLAFKVVTPDDRPILKTLAISTFTVCTMVPIMSAYAVLKNNGPTYDFPLLWITAVCRNFIMAFPIQIFIAGPLVRKIFRTIFS